MVKTQIYLRLRGLRFNLRFIGECNRSGPTALEEQARAQPESAATIGSVSFCVHYPMLFLFLRPKSKNADPGGQRPGDPYQSCFVRVLSHVPIYPGTTACLKQRWIVPNRPEDLLVGHGWLKPVTHGSCTSLNYQGRLSNRRRRRILLRAACSGQPQYQGEMVHEPHKADGWTRAHFHVQPHSRQLSSSCLMTPPQPKHLNSFFSSG